MDDLEKFIKTKILPVLKPRTRYIFRGENRKYKDPEKPISSGLYRLYCVKKKMLENDCLIIEKETVHMARKYFSLQTSNIEILTELQHYGGKTALIDFTYNLHIAIFFACSGGTPRKTGYLYIYPANGFIQKKEIEYNDNETGEDILVEPVSRGPRPIAQHSVFIHADKGYLDCNKYKCIIVKIDATIKKKLLECLSQHYNIKGETVFNDIFGFIKEQDIRLYEIENYMKGMVYSKNNNYSEAEKYFNKVIKLNPQDPFAYHGRGFAKMQQDNKLGAIYDYNKAIQVDPWFTLAYYSLGDIQQGSGKIQEAIQSFKKAKALAEQFKDQDLLDRINARLNQINPK